jgi:hypothetical protein
MKGTITKVWLAGFRTNAVSTQATTGHGTRRDAVDGSIGWLSTLDMPATREVVPA